MEGYVGSTPSFPRSLDKAKDGGVGLLYENKSN